MTEVIVRRKINREDILGHFGEASDFDRLITEDCDLYDLDPLSPDTKNEDNIIFKYRKRVFTQEEQDLAYRALRKAASESQNRGLAAGPRTEKLNNREWVTEYQYAVLNYFRAGAKLVDDFPPRTKENLDDVRGKVWLVSKIDPSVYGAYEGWFDRWVETVKMLPTQEQIAEANKIATYISNTNYAASVMSGIAGYFDRYVRIPYGRACGYNERNPTLFEGSYPYLRRLNSVFAKELPIRWKNQSNYAEGVDPRFRIADTVFTTLTVNHNWRTAGHRDAGDLTCGFSNISCVGAGWRGCYFTLPEWKIAIDLQPGDLVLVNNHAGIHTNTSFHGNMADMDRLSIVAYFRENMLELKSYEYESLRRQFVEERRLDPNHKLYHERWNGISPGMWSSREWAEYLDKNGMIDEDGLVSLEAKHRNLENFF